MSMKVVCLLLPLVLAGSSLHAQTTAWINEPGSVAVARDATDHVYTARWDYSPAGDIYVARRSASGTVLWEVHHDNQDSTRHEVATFVAADSGGNVLVSGTIRSGFSNPVNANSLLMKFGADGQLLWRRVYGSDFDGSSTRRVLMDPQDRAYVLGLGVCANGLVGTVRQFDADGSPGWIWCDSAGIGAPTMIKRTSEGHFLIAARGTVGSVQGYARIDASGQTLWMLTGIASLTVGDIAGDSVGNSYLVYANPDTGQGTRLRKLSPNGATLWERDHPMTAFRVEVAPDGTPVLAGFPSTGGGGAAFARFSTNGDLQWTQPDASAGLLLHSAMLIDNEGAAYLSGSTLSEMGVVKVNGDGSLAWSKRLPGGSTTGMVLGSAGQLYVSGGIYTARIDQTLEQVHLSGFEF